MRPWHRGDYDNVVEQAGDPIALAAAFAAAGAARIHLVDLDGARAGKARPEIVRAVAEAIAPARLQASGGIRSHDDMRGPHSRQAPIGSCSEPPLFPDPTPWAEELGDRLIVALDIRDGAVRTSGWTEGAGLSTERAIELCLAAGVGRVLLLYGDRP